MVDAGVPNERPAVDAGAPKVFVDCCVLLKLNPVVGAVEVGADVPNVKPLVEVVVPKPGVLLNANPDEEVAGAALLVGVVFFFFKKKKKKIIYF